MADFDLKHFTPYLLNIAAETSSAGFAAYYKDRYGMLRTEWRVLFHLGRYGAMTAKEVCLRAQLHKTKVSRAVSALEAKRFLRRNEQEHDRRLETLTLTSAGQGVYADLAAEAERFDATLMAPLTLAEREILHTCLTRIAGL
ncbi:MarR family transcriptional regulator [Sulfitobacter albidus]|uniref:MarR family transcriptional regulator n=1 Tax=Sulfitobacter albidus TaxID=2829501 RepID=A0A975JHS8_9RHOB|nr:MarR family transcriptional regulator [Sulfitobacter albidus]QUJ78180.1 MarR family transcriptional regulator [Sulfitobacter albidus]